MASSRTSRTSFELEFLQIQRRQGQGHLVTCQTIYVYVCILKGRSSRRTRASFSYLQKDPAPRSRPRAYPQLNQSGTTVPEPVPWLLTGYLLRAYSCVYLDRVWVAASAGAELVVRVTRTHGSCGIVSFVHLHTMRPTLFRSLI